MHKIDSNPTPKNRTLYYKDGVDGGFIAGCVRDLDKTLTQAFHLFFVATFAGAGLVSGGMIGWMIFKAIVGAE